MSSKKDVEFPQAHLYNMITYLSTRVNHVTPDDSKKPLFGMISYLSHILFQKTRGNSKTPCGRIAQTASPPVYGEETVPPLSSTTQLAEAPPIPPDQHGEARRRSTEPSGGEPTSSSQVVVTAQTASPPNIASTDENIPLPSLTTTLVEALPNPPDRHVARKRSAEPAANPVPKKKLDQDNRETKKKKKQPRKKPKTKDGVQNGSQRQPDIQDVPNMDRVVDGRPEPVSDDKILQDITNLSPDKVN